MNLDERSKIGDEVKIETVEGGLGDRGRLDILLASISFSQLSKRNL